MSEDINDTGDTAMMNRIADQKRLHDEMTNTTQPPFPAHDSLKSCPTEENNDSLLAEHAALLSLLKVAGEALEEIANSGKGPWTDMADNYEEQLRDTHHAFKMQQYAAKQALQKLKTAGVYGE